MADWTDIPNTSLEPDAPARSIDAFALRDNPVAITEGAAGAPRIQNAALATNAVTNVKVTNATLGAEKFQTGATERDWVLARTAAAARGAVGSYGFMTQASSSTSAGSTTAGSNLKYAAIDTSDSVISTFSPSGTWRNMTRDISTGFTGLFLRIS